jgi:4a-hydroxytetrahydrobiopterin dehydratase
MEAIDLPLADANLIGRDEDKPMDFHEKTCIPCLGGIPALSAAEVAKLSPVVPAWRIGGDATRLVREFKFKNYAEALAFVNAISAVAEKEGHHPDICLGWGYATVTLYTHKIQGLHENDFIMAAKFDKISAQ